MVYRKLSKTASLPVTCHQPSSSEFCIDKRDFGGRQRAEGFGCHEECEREPSVLFRVLLNDFIRLDQHPLGIVKWSAFAVLRLITNSNFIGCSTGKCLVFN